MRSYLLRVTCLVFILISSAFSQCPAGVTVTDANLLTMVDWATSSVNGGLTSKMDCSLLTSCVLSVTFPIPPTSIASMVTHDVYFVATSGTPLTQPYTTTDAANARTLAVKFSVSTISNLNPIITRNGEQLTYSFPVNIKLVNKCLNSGLAVINGNIQITINATTNATINSKSSMLQSNLPNCSPACTVNTKFIVNAVFCDTVQCTTTVGSKNFKLGDTAYMKVVLPDDLKNVKFKIFQGTYALLNADGSNAFQSEDIASRVTETQLSGYNIESWKVPLATDIVGPDGVAVLNPRTLSLNMFFIIVTGREIRYLQATSEARLLQGTETSQPAKVSMGLENAVITTNSSLSTNPYDLGKLNSSNNNTGVSPKTGSGAEFYGIGILFSLLALLL